MGNNNSSIDDQYDDTADQKFRSTSFREDRPEDTTLIVNKIHEISRALWNEYTTDFLDPNFCQRVAVAYKNRLSKMSVKQLRQINDNMNKANSGIDFDLVLTHPTTDSDTFIADQFKSKLTDLFGSNKRVNLSYKLGEIKAIIDGDENDIYYINPQILALLKEQKGGQNPDEMVAQDMSAPPPPQAPDADPDREISDIDALFEDLGNQIDLGNGSNTGNTGNAENTGNVGSTGNVVATTNQANSVPPVSNNVGRNNSRGNGVTNAGSNNGNKGNNSLSAAENAMKNINNVMNNKKNSNTGNNKKNSNARNSGNNKKNGNSNAKNSGNNVSNKAKNLFNTSEINKNLEQIKEDVKQNAVVENKKNNKNNKTNNNVNNGVKINKGSTNVEIACGPGNKLCKMNKKQLCEAISNHYMIRANIIAAILTMVPHKDDKSQDYEGSFCFDRLRALNQGSFCLPPNLGKISRMPIDQQATELQKYIGKSKKQCDAAKGVYKLLTPKERTVLLTNNDEYNKIYIAYTDQLQERYREYLVKLLEVLEILAGETQVNNKELERVANDTKELIDNMYKMCQFNYLMAMLAFVKLDLSRDSAVIARDDRARDSMYSGLN